MTDEIVRNIGDQKMTKYSGFTEERAQEVALKAKELGADVTYWARQTNGLRIDVAGHTISPEAQDFIDSIPESVHFQTGKTYDEQTIRRAAPHIADVLYEGSLVEQPKQHAFPSH